MSLKRTIGLFFLVSILLGAITCSEDNGLGPVSFDPPVKLTGTYLLTFDWLTDDSLSASCTAEFEFKSQGVFFMRVEDDGNTGSFDICSVEGTWSFDGDSLYITVTNENLYQDLCRPDAKPQARYRYTTDGDYIVFESRTPDPYRRIEIYGR
nr:hypothetical protein [candidate division Zixibacteria bacterium]